MSLDGPINEPRHGRPDDGRQPRPRHAAARVHRNFRDPQLDDCATACHADNYPAGAGQESPRQRPFEFRSPPEPETLEELCLV